ncbi:hypothetical protein QWY31_06015 [Cytophagales bacterium LB-30]|uniref:Capsule assembly Wzi family protein n=1 Tax=Shiella aurantiaca TaxID=3058365 RepID=A0ABT8F3V4_9BACT|nr:hypothetical protein [Shiella aurantiaca]MDN4165049.1 hypothetical protein [Shiella aurantiaca]
MKHLSAFVFLCLLSGHLQAQDSTSYRVRLDVPVFDYPQVQDLPYRYPSMEQALSYSKGAYDLAFWGIQGLGEKLFPQADNKNSSLWGKRVFTYGLGLAFAKYGSELPIPLGVWGHEEFHRSALGVGGLHSENGNWLFSRWDGTVYGVSDGQLADLKENNLSALLYSYISGVQYEVALNEVLSTENTFYNRTQYQEPLLAYNALYVYNYFRFSTSAASDSVKVIAPPHESADDSERDFAGADLTAWAYDMFQPELPYDNRTPFPDGEGVNRRVGFSDLPENAQDYLEQQKRLSLLNFINPGIFFMPRFRVSENFAFSFFTQYVPTAFGNAVSLHVPLVYRGYRVSAAVFRYAGYQAEGMGLKLGMERYSISDKLQASVWLQGWSQPQEFFADKTKAGGSLRFRVDYRLNANWSTYVQARGKTQGWEMGSPYLQSNVSALVGVALALQNK